MQAGAFETLDGSPVPAVTADEMRAVDRIATQSVGLGLLQMMENAGRNLAQSVLAESPEAVAVLVGDGGNGGGGLACARHLANRGVDVTLVLDRDPDDLSGAAAEQFRALSSMGVPVAEAPGEVDLVVDALVGYGLDGPARGEVARLIEAANDCSAPVLSLDVPSGTDATTGEAPGSAVSADRVVTLALPKTGLAARSEPVVLADIAIPAVVYDRTDLRHDSPFSDEYLLDLVRRE